MRIKEYFSHVRAGQHTGTSNWRGISAVLSGTTTLTVSAGAARSGSIITVTPLAYANTIDSGHIFNAVVGSVGTGFFTIQMVGSVAPKVNMNVGWHIIR